MAVVEFKKEQFLAWVRKETNWEQLSLKTKNAFSGWSAQDPQGVFTNLHAILNIADEVLHLVEKFSKEVDNLSGKDKLDLAVDFIDSLISLPRIVEWADQIVIRYVLSTVVQKKNETVGKDWFGDD